MFVRIKPSGPRSYLQVVENKRDGKKTRQRVIATLGRLDRLEAQGDLDSLAKSLARFSKKVRIVEGHRSGRLSAGAMKRIGPALVLEKLWKDLGLGRVIEDELRGRKFAFPVERAIFLTVLHRLFAQGSDRAADKCLPGVRQGSATIASRARTSYRCTTSIAPPGTAWRRWRGWVARKRRSRNRSSLRRATSLLNWTWCFSIPRRYTSPARAAKRWGPTGTRKTTGRT